nr:CHAP domain-containing protein [Tsuneonella mangrovi]
MQCVPYVRERTGIQIYGDALTWWDQAEGRYQRGHRPKKGAVMAFSPYRNMTLGHIAVVSRVIDSRTVLIDHANWSPIDGQRGQVERGVEAIDVSPNNDWSEVRVWYDPIQALGRTEWPVEGFIYPGKARGSDDPAFGGRTVIAAAAPATASPQPARATSREFLAAFADVGAPQSRSAMPHIAARTAPRQATVAQYERVRVRIDQHTLRTEVASNDPIDAAIARYDN